MREDKEIHRRGAEDAEVTQRKEKVRKNNALSSFSPLSANLSELRVSAVDLCIALGILLALVNGAINPLFEPPDEHLHYQFTRHLIDERTLPVQEIDGEPSHSHHPPLYYLLGAILTAPLEDTGDISDPNPHWTSYRFGEVHRDNKNLFLRDSAHSFPWSGTALIVHVLRLYSTALFAATLLFSRQIAYLIFPRSPEKRLVMLAFVALNPMLIYISSSFNNDNLLILLGTVLLLTSLRTLQNGFSWRSTILLGVLYGLAALTKLNGLVLGAVWGVVLLIRIFHRRDAEFRGEGKREKKSLRDLSALRASAVDSSLKGLTILTITLAMSGWWFVRNVRVYGDLFGFEVHFAVWGAREESEFGLVRFLADSRYAFSNFWGRFGYGQINLPGFIYWLFAVLVIAAIAGLVWSMVRRGRRGIRGEWIVLAVAAGLFVAAMFYYLIRVPVGANARYVFPVMAAVGALLAQGLMSWEWLRKRAVIVPAFLALTAVFGLTIFLPWTYAAPPSATVEEKAWCWLDETFCISQPVVTTRLHHSGQQEIVFDVCWETRRAVDTDYVLFVQLLDVDFNPFGSRNSHLGNGRFPTSLHEAGTAFCERVVVLVSAETTTPTAANVEFGLYHPVSGDRLPMTDRAGNIHDLVYAGRVRIEPTEFGVVQPVLVPIASFEGVDLFDYEWVEREDDTYLLRIFWRSTGVISADYTLFAHILDDTDTLLTQADGPLQNGAFPTSLWLPDDVIVDERVVEIPVEATHIRLGLYEPQTNTRLPRIDGDRLPDAVDLPMP